MFGRTSARSQGSILILVGILLVVLLGFAGFAVDIANGYKHLEILRAGTDAAALGGIQILPSTASGPAQWSAARDRAYHWAKVSGISDAELGYGSTPFNRNNNVGGVRVGTYSPSTVTGGGQF